MPLSRFIIQRGLSRWLVMDRQTGRTVARFVGEKAAIDDAKMRESGIIGYDCSEPAQFASTATSPASAATGSPGSTARPSAAPTDCEAGPGRDDLLTHSNRLADGHHAARRTKAVVRQCGAGMRFGRGRQWRSGRDYSQSGA